MEKVPDTFAERLLWAMEKRGLKAETLSMLAGGSRSTVTNVKLGKSANPRIDTAANLARALETTVGWLVEGGEFVDLRNRERAPRESFQRMLEVRGTVMGSIFGGLEGFRFTGAPPSRVPAPPGAAGRPNAYILTVRGQSMFPMYADGETVVVDPDAPNRRDDVIVFGIRHHDKAPEQSYIKRLVSYSADRLVVDQFDGNVQQDFDRRFVVEVHHVLTRNEERGL